VNQAILFLLAMSLWGIFLLQPLIRTMSYAEPVIKIILATIVGLGVAVAGFLNIYLPPLVIFVAILMSVFILAPVLLNMIAKNKHYTLAKQLNHLVYWSDSGRNAMKQFLARAALQRSDAGALEFLTPSDPLMIRTYALQQQWDQVLAMPTADSLEYHATRQEALIAKGHLQEAETELGQLRQCWEKNQTPEGYKIVMLSETRLEAERGQIEKVQKKVQHSLPGTPAHILFGLLARAAETSHHREPAINLYTQAYLTAPESQRQLYATKLQHFAQPLPEIQPSKTPYGTYALLITIIGAFLLQIWLENRFGEDLPRALAAFLLNTPEIPQSTARWRYLSYAFVHGGIIHIAFNAWSLFDLGKLYESRQNWANLLASFVIGSIMGAYFVFVVQGSQQLILVGASGGLLGIAGSLLADTWRSQSLQDRHLTRSLLQWMVMISVVGFLLQNSVGISFWGHTGGIIGGLLWGFIRQGLPQHKRIDWFIGGLSIGLMVYVFFQMLSLFPRLLP
jgi:membrane associated rhomboid family serine protease